MERGAERDNRMIVDTNLRLAYYPHENRRYLKEIVTIANRLKLRCPVQENEKQFGRNECIQADALAE